MKADLFNTATKSEFAAANPILSEGEIGYEIDSKAFKVGNGVTPYNSLGYVAQFNAAGTALLDPTKTDNSTIPLGNNGINISVAASRINAIADLNNILECNSGSAINITLKPFATVPARENDIITIYQAGTGSSLFVADAGVTIQGPAPIATQYGHIAIRYRGSDVWAWI